MYRRKRLRKNSHLCKSTRQHTPRKQILLSIILANLEPQITRGGGKVILVEMGTPIQTLPVSAAALREVDLVGVWRYAKFFFRGLEIMERCVRDKSIPDLRGLLTHSYDGLSRVPEAF